MEVLSKKRVFLADQPTQPLRPVLRRAPIWIRPKYFSLELKIFEKSQIFSARKMTPQLRLRLGLDLLGVLVLLGALAILTFRISMSSDAQIYSSRDEASTNCASTSARQACKPVSGPGTPVIAPRTPAPSATGVTPTVQASVVASATGTPTPVSARVTLTPIPTPTVNPTPISTPIIVDTPVPTPDPSPGNANLAVYPLPVPLSYANNCLTQRSLVITLTNTGTSLLLWIEDKTRTSPGLNIISPTNVYLLPPGLSILATISCSSVNAMGTYFMNILYDGGDLLIPVTVGP